jgi:fructose-bisphosphate aldolase class II
MLLHVVQFEFRADVPEPRRDEILAAARRMLSAIPGVTNLIAGRSIRSDGGFPHAIAMTFADRAALESYRAHPDHVRFRDELFFPFLARKASLDYEE